MFCFLVGFLQSTVPQFSWFLPFWIVLIAKNTRDTIRNQGLKQYRIGHCDYTIMGNLGFMDVFWDSWLFICSAPCCVFYPETSVPVTSFYSGGLHQATNTNCGLWWFMFGPNVLYSKDVSQTKGISALWWTKETFYELFFIVSVIKQIGTLHDLFCLFAITVSL